MNSHLPHSWLFLMRLSGGIVSGLLCVTLGAGCQSLQEKQGGGTPVPILASHQPLAEALQKRVSVSFDNQPLPDALRIVMEAYKAAYPESPPLNLVECHRSDRPTDAPYRRLTAAFADTPVVDILRTLASVTESGLELDDYATIVFRTFARVEYSETMSVLRVGPSFLRTAQLAKKPESGKLLAWFALHGVQLPSSVQIEVFEAEDGATLVLHEVPFTEAFLMEALVRLTERGVIVNPVTH